MNVEVVKNRISRVLRVDSIDSTEYDFLATHVPFRRINVITHHGSIPEEIEKTEEEVYRDIFVNTDSNEHQFIIVEGSSGAGKSHFIRWLNARLNVNDLRNDVVLLIRRSDNTLKGTIRQLLEINEVKKIANKEIYERLVRANQTISEQKFKSTIYHQFIIEIENDKSEKLSRNKIKRLIALLNNSAFQDKMMSAGGPIERIYHKIVHSSANVDVESVAQFRTADLTLDVDFFDLLDDADQKARSFAKNLMEDGDDEFIQKITDYLNSFVEVVVQTSAGIEPGDFQQIFKEIRQELYRQGKSLILLVEDITSFTGVNQALLNALITSHAGENALDEMCRLISVVGTTSEYYRQFRDNYRDRITKQVTIHDGTIGDNQSDLIEFFAKYLNAISLEERVLDEWVSNGAYVDDLPIHEEKVHQDWDWYEIAPEKRISLFPFTKNAILNLYYSMSDNKTPRYILRDIIEPAINEVVYDISAFPKFCRSWRTAIPESVENRIGSIVSMLDIPESEKTEYRQRLVAFISFWSNKALEITSDGCISGVEIEVYRELAFSAFVDQLQATSQIVPPKNVPNNIELQQTTVPEHESASTEIVQTKPIVQKAVFQIDSKQQRDYDAFKQHVISWHRDGKQLIQFLQVREVISDFVYDTINWQQEGVPLDSIKRFKDSVGSHLIGVERQDQAIDKSIFILDDTEETYQLLLCFGKWTYLGKKSWKFPDAASAAFFATSWLENNKSRFVNAANNIAPGCNMPPYIKAAIIQQAYTRLLNGTAGVSIDSFLLPNADKNSTPSFINGHSKSWYDVHRFIYSQDILADTYTASVRFFNLIQGSQLKSNIFVLNYPLVKAVQSEIKLSQLMLSEEELSTLEKRVKDKREIFKFAEKTSKKIHDVVADEIELANRIACEITSFFDGFDMEDDIEASDIRTLLDEVLSFYQKCVETGINIRIQENLESVIQKIKSSADSIAAAIGRLKDDYSGKDDFAILQSFADNPIGSVQFLLSFLKKTLIDVEDAKDKLEAEKMKHTKEGSWIDNTDPRFSEENKRVQELVLKLEGVI